MDKNTKKFLILFVISVPFFFMFVVAGLYFIHVEELVKGPGLVKATKESRIYAPEDGFLESYSYKEGDNIKKPGLIIAKIKSIALDEQYFNISNAIKNLNTNKKIINLEQEMGDILSDIEVLNQTIKLLEIKYQLLTITPVSDKVQNASHELDFLETKINVLSARNKKYKLLNKQGILSKIDIENIQISLADAKSEKGKALHDQEKMNPKRVSLILTEAREGIKLNKIKVNQKQISLQKKKEQISLQKEINRIEEEKLNFQKEVLQKRLDSLIIVTPVKGKVIFSKDLFVHLPIKKGELIYSISETNTKEVKIKIKENEIARVSVGNKIRFESSTFSIYESEYFWGEVTRISPGSEDISNLSTKDHSYTVYASLLKYGNQLNDEQKINKLPFGSSGEGSISIGKKSLLLQLIGWN